MFISILNMFRATSCSSSGESIVSVQHLLCVGDRLVCRSGRNSCIEQPRANYQETQLYQCNTCYVPLCVGDRLVCRSGRNWVPLKVIIHMLLALVFSLIIVEIHRRLEGNYLQLLKRGTENSDNFEEMSQNIYGITYSLSCRFLTVSFSRTALSVCI
jgi:hypothetical protein